ncbi:hypothetical protein LZ32DRAFT_608413 [Colletotrichum eremochloae]|nr:hypothetical protein LZ32DRAFT_608413 [Colletotrichum eremochloae]
MGRKGSKKTRTGCITCKIRKVKCDEAKPACKRCTRTGWRCHGYGQASPGREAVIMHQPHRAFPGVIRVGELRALQYFSEVAGPVLPGPVDPYFWTHVVMQFSFFEPAVRHAVIAISSLYEHAQGTFELATAMQYPYDNHYLAIHHYNAAIHDLRATGTDDRRPVVLLVCVLFICIEIMRCNRKDALRHSRHGTKILKDYCREHKPTWITQHLLPIFRRLLEFAMYFGEEATDFVSIEELEDPFPQSFTVLSDAQTMFDVLFNRTAKLGRSHRIAQRKQQASSSGRKDQEVDIIAPEHLAEQASIEELMDQWLKLFDDFTNTSSTHPDAQLSGSDSQSKLMHCFLLTRFECGRLWLRAALDNSETSYDRYLADFRRILKRLLRLEAEVPKASHLNTSRRPHFVFEAGFGAFLFFLLSVCRDLETRLGFLRLIPILGLPRENMWRLDLIAAAGKKIIETEHGIKLDDSGQPISLLSHVLPPDEARVTDLWMGSPAQEDNPYGRGGNFIWDQETSNSQRHGQNLPPSRHGVSEPD